MKKSVIAIVIFLAVALAAGGAAYALTTFAKDLAAYGQVKFTGQVTVTESKLDGNDTIKVKLQSNAQTVADRIYTVHLYLNGDEAATEPVSWSAPQIPGNSKVKTFTGLDLAAITSWDIEVTH